MVFSNSLVKEVSCSILGAVIITASLFFAPKVAQEKKILIAPPPKLEFYSFGYQFVIADSLWLRAIQDIEYCEVQVAKNRCQSNSWLYQMLEVLTTLAPDYLIAYREGGIALSVVISDSEGATKIYEKGIRVFPQDFRLVYRTALHAYYDEKNYLKAANLFLQAARIQGLEGTWLYSLASRLYADAGKKDIALRLYQQMLKEGLDEITLKRMREKLGIDDE